MSESSPTVFPWATHPHPRSPSCRHRSADTTLLLLRLSLETNGKPVVDCGVGGDNPEVLRDHLFKIVSTIIGIPQL